MLMRSDYQDCFDCFRCMGFYHSFASTC